MNDVVEIGATNFFYNRTKDIRLKLKEFFPEDWELLYTISLISAVYEGRFRRLKTHYEDSILSYVFPNLNFNPANISLTLKELGRSRDRIKKLC